MTHKFTPLHFFISLCQLAAVISVLVQIRLMASKLPPYLPTMFLVFGILGVVVSLRQVWIFARKGDLWMVGNAGGLFLYSLALLDLWDRHGEVWARDIVLLILSGVATLPVVGGQLFAWTRKEG